jgi:hypothetical protein
MQRRDEKYIQILVKEKKNPEGWRSYSRPRLGQADNY